jgi:demethylmacrocin O-methyltransferase
MTTPDIDGRLSEIDPLTRLAIKHGTDKWGAHFYTPIYHELFRHRRDDPVRLLEIGIGAYASPLSGGASLAMWADYFPAGYVVGIDVAEKRLDLGARVKLVRGSQNDGAFLNKLVADHGPFDIIIDDGSHIPKHVVACFNILFRTLTDGGIYVIEDIQTTFWPQFGGSPAGGDTMGLASAILKAMNYMEVLIAAPDWRVPTIARNIRSFRAYHNLFIVEKGENCEPSNLSLAANEEFAKAVAIIERELAERPTPNGLAHLAVVLSQAGEFAKAHKVVTQALARWPNELALLKAGISIARRVGDNAMARRCYEEAVAICPDDPEPAILFRNAAGAGLSQSPN